MRIAREWKVRSKRGAAPTSEWTPCPIGKETAMRRPLDTYVNAYTPIAEPQNPGACAGRVCHPPYT